MARAIYPGTFDPVTNGHVDIVERASHTVEHLTVGVVEVSSKRTMFNVDERIKMFSDAVAYLPNVSVKAYSGLTVNAAREIGATVIVRGLRITSDFEYESEMALMNRRMAEDVETVCLFSALQYQILSSSRVKEVAALGADVSGLVPKNVWGPLVERLEQRKQTANNS
ncbi:MAG: pantetheine-phosphate adenylyltransferase [Chloroflexi bacterium]|jgi:pantetheine-phosphate adenylyltransferase|nr:pantetheine-phosphate adenylyltransferase [Chloroflexota bacterium]MBT3863442.1 pantetheine-phosphate adenylyltransferase [Chloroflexota bacterium]MBT4142125.1 pantetheine-phosphate adenylyltransferase [Chloroflexota bacterium]MBT4341396.1 pantetheine-phosphate adenylyltransferase [Chloroflexota bacterium]MBT4942871.1 pantetheine-phosphate adenylyltransferase [Chloroflexota bacterium]